MDKHAKIVELRAQFRNEPVANLSTETRIKFVSMCRENRDLARSEGDVEMEVIFSAAAAYFSESLLDEMETKLRESN